MTSEIDGENNSEVKPSEYVKDLLKEKMGLSPEEHPHAMRLLEDEVLKAQAQTQAGKIARPDVRYVDVYKEKPIKVSAKVLVPVKEHPRFNFVGKLLGPKGNSLKRLQEETMTKMAILGRGSMRDKEKEEEMRNSLDPKYSHLADDLHVEVIALAPPAEAYARIAFALAEIRKFMVPDVNDEIRQEQYREISAFPGRGRGGPPMGRGGIRPPPPGRGIRPAMPPGPRMMGPPPAGPPTRPPGKAKVLSILDRARAAMEEYPTGGGYDDSSYYEPPAAAPMSYESGGYGGSGGSAYNGSGYYEGGYGSAGTEASGGWKSYGSQGGMGDMSGSGGKTPSTGRFGGMRSSPYSRPSK